MDLKALRMAEGLTLQELADATGSSKSYIWELENKPGLRPSALKLAKIAKALHVTVEYLLGPHDHIDLVEEAKDQAFYDYYRQLPKDKKQKMRQLLEIIQ